MSSDADPVERAELTAADVAFGADVEPDQVDEWESLGLLSRAEGGQFDPDALVRAQLLKYATRRGLTGHHLAEATQSQGDVMARSVRFLGAPSGRARSLDDAAEELGLEPDLLRRLWVASGFGDEARLFDDDLNALRGLAAAREAGLPEEALVQVARVFGDTLGRIGDLEVRLFHFYVHEQLRASGLSDEERSELTTTSGEALMALVEPALLYYHRKAWQRALREDVMLHVAEDVDAAGVEIGELTAAVLFIDLAGYTALTDAMGDSAAAAVLDRFSDMVRESASEHEGRIVKQIGDEFMLVFPDGVVAVRCALDVCRRASAEHEFPALRLGAHAGSVLYRDADYLGSTVNIAARATAQAEGGQLIVTETVRRQADVIEGLTWAAIGRRQLKGLTEPIGLYLVSTRDPSLERLSDPVCGMGLDPERTAYQLEWRGQPVWFCSERCMDQFQQTPAAFGS